MSVVPIKLLSAGTLCTLRTERANGIPPMVEIVKDDGQWIRYRGAFGGTKIRRSRRTRVLRVLNSPAPPIVADKPSGADRTGALSTQV